MGSARAATLLVALVALVLVPAALAQVSIREVHPSRIYLMPGEQATVNITLGGSGTVTLTVEDLPTGVSASYPDGQRVNAPGTYRIVLTAAENAPETEAWITVKAGTASTTVRLVVSKQPGVLLEARRWMLFITGLAFNGASLLLVGGLTYVTAKLMAIKGWLPTGTGRYAIELIDIFAFIGLIYGIPYALAYMPPSYFGNETLGTVITGFCRWIHEGQMAFWRFLFGQV